MNNKIASDTANSAKTLAQQIAKQMSQEPYEVLKKAREQTLNLEYLGEFAGKGINIGDRKDNNTAEHEIKDKARSERLIQALNRELEDIRKQNLFKSLQERIMQGEIIPLEEYAELTMDQKQVLKAQMEAVQTRIRQSQSAGFKDVPAIHSKPSRRFGAGQKQEAEKQQTRIEKPVPPSG